MSFIRDLASAALARVARTDDVSESDYTSSAWQNLANGMGGSTDRASYQVMSGVAALPPRVLSSLMLSDWIARRIVTANPFEAFRLGAQVAYRGESERDKELVRQVQAEADRLALWSKCHKASTFGRGYGGTIIHVVTDDAQVEEELVHERVRQIYSLDIYNPNEVTPNRITSWDPFDVRPTDPTRQWPDHKSYNVSSQLALINDLHPSRVATFGGLLTSRPERWDYFRGWDAPILQPVWDQLRDFAGTNQSITRMMQSASQAILKIPNLWELVVKGGKDRLRSRLQAATLASSVGNTLPINADEEMSFVERTFSGIKDLGEFELLLVAGAAEMPATILFGREPAGMSATGSGDRAAWYSSVEARRQADYGPPMIGIVQLIATTQGATDPSGWGIEWPSLERLTSLEQAQLEEQHTMTDQARIDMGFPAKLVLAHRYSGGEYRTSPPLLTEADLEEMLAVGAEPEGDDVKPEDLERDKGAPAEAVDPQTALNGAQVSSLLETVQQVVSGLLPRESAVELITAAYPVDRDTADRILGDVGKKFEPVIPEGLEGKPIDE